ncbi:unnamed protein product [Rhodiola kirilowii]
MKQCFLSGLTEKGVSFYGAHEDCYVHLFYAITEGTIHRLSFVFKSEFLCNGNAEFIVEWPLG